MSTSTPPPPSLPPVNDSENNTTSYSMLESGDVEAIGAHCNYEYCHQLDFLPFKCQSCGHKYCLDHRTEDSHSCPNKGAWARSRRENTTGISTPTEQKPTLLTAQQCSSPSCKTFINTSQNVGVHCSTCNRTYCLKHRFPEEHACKTLTPLGARPLANTLDANREKLKVGFGRLRAWGARMKQDDSIGSSVKTAMTPPPITTKAKSKAAQLAELNKLKQTATGDAKVPTDKRVYLHVSATEKITKDGKPKEAAMWFSSEWKIGKVLDLVASKLNVENLNNSVSADSGKRLHVYHVESGEVLGFGEPVGQRLLSGNSLVLVRGLDV